MRRLRWRAMGLVPIALCGAASAVGCGSTTTVTVTTPPATSATSSTGSTSGSPTPSEGNRAQTGSNLKSCDPNISAGAQTSCPFAENVFEAYADSYQAAGGTEPAAIDASSPTTGQSYSMSCQTSNGVITCSGGQNAVVTLPLQAIEVYGPVQPTTTTAPAAPSSATEDVGSYSHAADAQFCSTHQCIGNFQGESGYIVQCMDGAYSHAGGIQGACSHHGGA